MAFNDWNFKFKSFMGNISAPLMQSMSSIEHRQDVLETSGYTEEQSQMAAGLYYQLTMYTEGTPLGVVRKVTSHDGFEAYRRLAYQYNPQTLGGQLAKLMRIVEFDFGEDGVFLDRMATFEVLIEEYQVAGKEVVSDNLRCAILVTRAPVALRNHLLLNASRDLNWTDVKRSAMDFLLATTFNPVPMDIGHVKGGKPYGGGKYKKAKVARLRARTPAPGRRASGPRARSSRAIAADADDGAIARRTATRGSTTRRSARPGRRTPR